MRRYPTSRARLHVTAVLCSSLLALQLSGCSATPRQQRDILYLAIGASDALGIGASPLRNGYVYRIRDELEQQTRRNVRLLNWVYRTAPRASLGRLYRWLSVKS